MYFLNLTHFKNNHIILTNKYFIIININGILKFRTNFYNLFITNNTLYLNLTKYKYISNNINYYYINKYYLFFKNNFTNQLLNYYNTYLNSLYLNFYYSFYNYHLILNLKGIGYKFIIENSILKIRVGYSHFINYTLDKDVFFLLKNPTSLILYNNNKIILKQIVSYIKLYKKSNLYKGTGIYYNDEIIILKKKNNNKNKNAK